MTGLRQRLAGFRDRTSPAGSLLDFAVWSLRHGLPWRAKTLPIIIVGTVLSIAGAIYFVDYRLPILIVLACALALLVFSVALAYARTLIATRTAELRSEREALEKSMLEAFTIRTELKENLRAIESKLELGQRQEARARDDSLTGMRTEIDARLSSLKGDVLEHASTTSQQMSELEARLNAQTKSHATELRRMFENEFELLLRQLQRVDTRQTRLAADFGEALQLLSDATDALRDEQGGIRNRVQSMEDVYATRILPARQQLDRLTREVASMAARDDVLHSNDARLIEYLESTMAKMQDRLRALDSEVRKRMIANGSAIREARE
ncbi:hypothetical protein [Maricaulis sp.]|uniref:hypothetical protein n=1 Tax=Maricaulis sp. TaxID=1486257 RepID=UPI0025C15F2F|nr:hypothetical protein [Maricaulis sp.]